MRLAQLGPLGFGLLLALELPAQLALDLAGDGWRGPATAKRFIELLGLLALRFE